MTASAPGDHGVPRKGTTADWEAVERMYRVGVLSIREIAKQHGITEGAVRKRGKKDGWQRDLTAKVQDLVRSELVRSPVRSADQIPERVIVAEAAAAVVQVVREHRVSIKAQRSLAGRLLEQLHDVTENREAIEGEIVAETGEADNPDATKAAQQAAWARRGQMLRAVSLPQNAGTLRDLSTVLKTIVELERRAFNVDTAPEPPAPEEARATSWDAIEARLQLIFAIGVRPC